MERAKRIVRSILLAFVLVSIGFALGKQSVRHRATVPAEQTGGGRNAEDDAASLAVKVRVYYLHATFRCVTCNTIESMTRDLLDKQFGDAVADGRIQWQEADFQENESLAKQFDVIASCVVVAKVQGGNVLDHQRLDDVWTMMKDPPEFNAYVGGAIRSYLPATTAGGAE
jgi:transcription elongation factor Elf1